MAPPLEEPWRPMPLRKPFLLTLAGLMLLCLVALEALRSYSNRFGGVVTYNDYADISTSTTQAFALCPIPIALVIVTLWNFCSYDVMRLEPYFQLAKPQGVSAAVLFISYNFSFGIMAPVTAARNRHWVVFCVSLMSLVVRLLLPALHAGLVEPMPLNVTTVKEVKTWPHLIDLQSQAAWISNQITPHDWSTTEPQLSFFPSFEYAVAPVTMSTEDQNDSSRVYVNQTVYWANMTCVDIPLPPANISVSNSTSVDPQSLLWSVRDIQVPRLPDASTNCTIHFALEKNTRGFQLRHWEPSRRNSTLNAFNTSSCDPFDVYGIVIDLNGTTQEPIPSSGATAFGCTAKYQHVEAEVSWNVSQKITDLKVHPPTLGDLGPSEFRIDVFQELMGFRSKEPANQFDKVNPKKYQQEVVNIWKQDFILIMNKIFDPNQGPDILNAQHTSTRVTLSCISKTAFSAEIIIFLAVLLLFYLAYFYPRRPSILRFDPGSIAAQCRLIEAVFHPHCLLTHFDAGLQQATTRQLRQRLKNLYCQWQEGPHGRRIALVSTDSSSSSLSSRTARKRQDPVPHFLMIPCFVLECLSFAGTLGLFALALQRFGVNPNLSLYTEFDLFLIVFLLYGPTMIASIITSVMDSNLHHLSVLEPWVQLQKGSTAKSLTANYASRNAFAVLGRCARRAPLLLVAMSVACILNSILSIVTGGVFVSQPYKYIELSSSLALKYNLSTFLAPASAVGFDGFNLISSRMMTSDGDVSLLPWTFAELSFWPINVNETAYEDSFYTATTRGIGADLICDELPVNLSLTDSSGRQYWQYKPLGDHSDSNCTVEVPTGLDESIARYIHYLTPSGAEACQAFTIVVIARWNLTDSTALSLYNTVAVHCEPRIRIQDYVVDFDHDGYIEDRRPVSNSSITSGELFHNATKGLGQYNEALAQFFQVSAAHSSSSFQQYDWPGVLTDRIYDGQGPASLTHAVVRVYQTVFSTYLALWRDTYLESLAEPSIVNGTLTTWLYSVLPSMKTMIVIVVILSIDILVLVMVFLSRRGRFNGPRIPKSIGSLIPWVVHSQMMVEFRGKQDWSEAKWQDHFENLDRKFRFFGDRLDYEPDCGPGKEK